jgi:pilus assembly protein Flp/PilA
VHSNLIRFSSIRRNNMRSMIRFLKQDEGATAIEYGLIASLIAVAIVGVLVTLGPKLAGVFTTVQSNL